ncbi:hypothetical protein B0T17DRAFT_480897 [Bombardia bombarda]|uniref:Protein kinase domain-containing protein n=1 Tax=Bombardia bombarda TaxID=252184 RepID=A0AA39XKV0_9PEZI|nr:hypothetical protein B0T17DRAFT_480897 [Bombardia bombarda]
MSYSNGSGGTLTLPSPTHAHHADVGSAVRSFRRSMSRSPSKFKLRGSSSPTPATTSATFQQSQTTTTTTPFASRFDSAQSAPASVSLAGSPSLFSTPQASVITPSFRSNFKLSVRSARQKPPSRTRVSPKSPLKRVFGPSQDSGNPIPSSLSEPVARGQEKHDFNDFPLALSPVRRNIEKQTRHSVHLDMSGSSKNGISKFLEAKNDTFPSTYISPMKRSDAIMGLDQNNMGSRDAKRRSLHGGSSLGSEFSIFDYQPPVSPQKFDVHEDGNHEYQLTGSSVSSFRESLSLSSATSTTPTGLPKRSSSLRKSTLQQRHGDSRISWGRRAGEKQLAQLANETSTPLTRNRPRLSLDQYLPPTSAALPNPSLHLIPRPANQPHPLSRTVTQSSSSSSLPDDSPTHVPMHIGEKPRVPLNFSKSLPPGSLRPTNDSDPVATPQYKRAKPLQAAFMSTGLVSKMTRNPDLGELKRPEPKVTVMPDTPCKKQPYNSATYPPQVGSGGRRSHRPSFGSPSTPFSSISGAGRGTNPFGDPDKPGSLFFQNVRSRHARKSSLLSLDGDDHGAAGDTSDDFPPTPTKNLFFKSFTTPAHVTQTPNPSRTFALPTSAFGYDEHTDSLPSCKSQISQEVTCHDREKKCERPIDIDMDPSTPSAGDGPRMSISLPSFSQRQAMLRPLVTPTPVRTFSALSAVHGARLNQASRADSKLSASPLHSLDYTEGSSPQTPQDSMIHDLAPLDASRLSLHHSQDDNDRQSRTPATPTTQGRHLFSSFGERPFNTTPQHGTPQHGTPQHGSGPKDVDESLVLRFEKSKVIGKGEFSKVYRVVKFSMPKSLATAFMTTPSRRAPSSSGPEKVYAVKKIRLPTHGINERESKLREVAILRALSNSDKIIHFLDSWEQNGHLYIQTEYCTEGSLDGFLKSVGQAGRLDDFRIWKILLETSQGLAAIHDAGFIHLDIKPANIFVGFDGYLKIGDFGMAAYWPAAKGIEGEGDREYIGPEILLGQFDKPADIFALGLIILEIACNVFLPDNGPTWQALRNGDLSTVPSLTSGEAKSVFRDANGMPVDLVSGISHMHDEDSETSMDMGKRGEFPFEPMTHDPSNLFGTQKRSDLQEPPIFMMDSSDPNSLDSLVRWMIQPNPTDRPTAQQLLASESVCWVSSRRGAGATVFEGNWGPYFGPSVEELEELVDTEMDTEMTDV